MDVTDALSRRTCKFLLGGLCMHVSTTIHDDGYYYISAICSGMCRNKVFAMLF